MEEKDKIFKVSVLKETSFELTRFKARRVRHALRLKVFGGACVDYQKINALLQEMKNANPEMQFKIDSDLEGHFSTFVCSSSKGQ